MLKKRTALLFLTLAYAILLWHNIIVHHHPDHDHQATEQHDSDHPHDDDADNDGLNRLFAHFTHSTDGFSFTITHNITSPFSKQQLSFVAALPDNFALDEFLIPPLLDKPPAEHLIYISPHSQPCGLRAPPATFI